MTSPFDKLTGSGKPLKAEPPDTKEIAGLCRSGLARLKDAANDSLSLEGRFDLAYNAAHALCLAALRRQGYPILLFTERDSSWCYEGAFSVAEIENRYVVLERGYGFTHEQAPMQEEVRYQEGGRRYVTHLMAERSKGVVKVLKANSTFVCDICKSNFAKQYGVEYIEAHHKVPISTYSVRYVVKPEDFALLCPNCHRAVHIYMKRDGLDYLKIKEKLCGIEPAKCSPTFSETAK